MKRKSRLFINSDEFYKIAEKSMKLIKEKEFALAFPEYLGKAGQVMEGINSQAEWAAVSYTHLGSLYPLSRWFAD